MTGTSPGDGIWRQRILAPSSALLLVWTGLALVHAQTWLDLWRVWRTNVVFHHGAVVFVVALALILRCLGRLPAGRLQPLAGPSGWAPAAVVSWGWLAAWLADIDIGMHLAVLLLTAGAVPALFGWQAAWRLRFALFYLLLSLPAGLSLIAPLQHLTADLAVTLLDLFAIAHLRDGFVIELMTPQGLARFSIEAACSGIRYLFASVSVGVLFAWIGARRLRHRLAIVIIFVVVPILANAVRAAGIVALASAIGASRANAIDHRLYGEIFFLITLALSFALALPWARGGSAGEKANAATATDDDAKAAVPHPASNLAPAIMRYLLAGATGPMLALAWRAILSPAIAG